MSKSNCVELRTGCVQLRASKTEELAGKVSGHEQWLLNLDKSMSDSRVMLAALCVKNGIDVHSLLNGGNK